MVDYKAVYMAGKGRLVHNTDGFVLYDADGKVIYSQGPLASRGVCADYFWYEIGDVICIGNKDAMYYCFLSDAAKIAKTRYAVPAALCGDVAGFLAASWAVRVLFG